MLQLNFWLFVALIYSNNTQSVYIILWVIFACCVMTVFLIQKTKRPGTFAGCLVFSLMLCIFLSWMEPLSTKVQMTVLDVGQGQSILLQSDGRTYIVDCGGDSDEKTADLIAETLLAQGICRVDGIIVTHLDRDHAGALPYLMSRVDSDFLFLPDAEETLNLPDTQSTCIYVEKDQKLEFNGTRIQIFGSGYKGSGNENSLCVLFEHENCVILITGDRSTVGEQMLLRKAFLPKVDVLIAGHHGSKDSTGEALLRATSPETVIISVGEDNIYGHPSEDTLARLERSGCVVYRTDQMGTIRYRR
ncbi:MAG: MBL fold metallo-hydrolase [Lachnospiraceae bacterium]|nr:MBL fold metallo-hydrolase [Lachnospiraceae bacterium]